MYYFFLYPAGHTGLAAVTFFNNLPLTQVIVTETVFLMVVVVVGVTLGKAKVKLSGAALIDWYLPFPGFVAVTAQVVG